MEEPQTTRAPITPSFTPEDLDLVLRAAAETHQTPDDFVRNAAVDSARTFSKPPRRSYEELMGVIQRAQQEFAAANTSGRNPLEELIAERRAAAAAGE